MRYGVIGNRNTAALVHESGAIEWCCLPRFDSRSMFTSILDPGAGSFKVTHARPALATQSYLHGTAILRTEFDDGEGAFALTDFMPRYHDGRVFQKPLEIHRVLTPLRGRPAVRVTFHPRLDYARNHTGVRRRDGMIEASNALEDVFLYSSLDLDRVLASEPIEISGEEFLVLSYHEKLVAPTHAVIAIVSILASAIMPLSRMTVKRVKETELRSALRIMRTAIVAFNKDCVTKKLATENCTKDNFPETLDVLTQPLKLAGAEDKTKKYLRRIPRDPFGPPGAAVDEDSWGLRSYNDRPDSSLWGGENIYDVYSKSDGVASDGTKYSTW